MDSKLQKYVSLLSAAFLIVLRRFILLVVSPYKTMRKISIEKDYAQLAVIFLFVCFYFLLTGFSKIPTFFIAFGFALFFFYYVGRAFDRSVTFASIISTLSYTLLPTFIWFYTSYLFYIVLPPPRTPSVLGKAFSILYISFSLSLLLWKIILTYLAIRFSLKLQFYRVAYLMLLYVFVIISASYVMYVLGYSKVPFI